MHGGLHACLQDLAKELATAVAVLVPPALAPEDVEGPLHAHRHGPSSPPPQAGGEHEGARGQGAGAICARGVALPRRERARGLQGELATWPFKEVLGSLT